MTVEKVSVEQVVSAIKALQAQGISDVTVQDIRESLGRGRVLDIARLLPIAREYMNGGAAAPALGDQVPPQLQEAVEYLWTQMRRTLHGEPDPYELGDQDKSLNHLKREMHGMTQALMERDNRIEELEREIVHHSESEQRYRSDLERSNEAYQNIQSALNQAQKQWDEKAHQLRSESEVIKLRHQSEEKSAIDERKRRERLEVELSELTLEYEKRASQMMKDNQQLQQALSRTRHDLDTVSRIRDRLESNAVNLQRMMDEVRDVQAHERETAVTEQKRLLERIERMEKLIN